MRTFQGLFRSLLAVCLLLGLTACGEAQETGSVVYVPEQVKFSAPLSRTEGACILGESFYLVGAVRDDESFDETISLVRVPLEGGRAEALPTFRPFQMESDEKLEYGSITGRLRAGAEGTLWLEESVYYQRFDLPEDFDPETDAGEKYQYISDSGSFWVLRQLDSEGNELFSFNGFDLQRELGAAWLADLYSDGAGTVFVSTDSAVILLDEAGTVRATLEGGVSGQRFVTLGDGRTAIPVTAQGVDGAVTQLRVIDAEAGDWAEESFSVPAAASDFQDGDGEALFYYLDGDSLYAWRQGAEEPERMMSWAESGVDCNNMAAFAFLPDGRLAAITGALAGFGDDARLTVLTATDAASMPERTVLRLAVLTMGGDLQTAVADFNANSDTCFISVTEYPPEYPYGDAEWDQARLRMATALTAGAMPDIICGQPSRGMEAQGLLEDLWPYIDADPELSRDGLMTRPLEAMAYKGGLYSISNAFKINTFIGAKDVVGDRTSWSYDEFWEAYASMPEGSAATDEFDCKNGMLRAVVECCASRFIDRESGGARFDGEEFRALLEFCSRFPDEAPVRDMFWIAIYDGEQMIYPYGINHFSGLQEIKALFGGELSYVGWPNNQGQTGSSFSMAGIPLSIAAGSEHKEEAWSFLRRQLLPSEEVSLKNEIGSGSQLPINRQDFERMVELVMTPQMGEPGGVRQEIPQGAVWVPGVDEPVYYYAMTQEDYDRFMDLYNATDTASDYDANILSIITEQAGAYFAGDRSLDETVAAVQSRVGLYLAEMQ